MSRAVILTALRVEYLAVRIHLTNLQEEIHPKGTIYERGKFSVERQTWDVGIVEIYAGNPRVALEAERAINYFNPEVILFVGVAGGIKDVVLGDVVASTKVYGYESGKAEQTFKLRAEIGLSAYGLEQRARAEARKDDWRKRLPIPDLHPIPRVFVAPIAAGEKVITSTESEVCQFLRSNYGDALAVEMEGFGFLEAARANQQVSAMVIRGISDLLDNKADADKTGYQEIASRHASAFAFEVLAKIAKTDTQRMPVDIKEFNYTQLEKFLADKNWKEADKETAKLMLQIAHREQQGFIDSNSLRKFPCSNLRAIDQLWQIYSKNLFGFSVQKRIYQMVRKRLNETNNSEIWKQFGEEIGWRREQRWIRYSDLNLTNLVEGLFPAADYEGLGGVWFHDGLALFDRLDTCEQERT